MSETAYRRDEALFASLFVLSDASAIGLSFVLAYWMRFDSPLVRWIPVTKGTPAFAYYLWTALAVVPCWIALFRAFGLYELAPRRSGADEFVALLKAVAVGCLVAMSAAFLYRGFSYSRLVFAYIGCISILFLTGGRTLCGSYLRRVRARGRGLRRCALVGGVAPAGRLADEIVRNPQLGYRLVGTVEASLPGLPELGRAEEIGALVREHHIDLLILAIPLSNWDRIAEIITRCEGLDVSFKLMPDFFEVLVTRMSVGHIDGIPLIGLKESPLSGSNATIKRTMDLVVSLLGLAALSPLFLLAALAIKLTSRGPVLYPQQRVGRDGRAFVLYKFRSMVDRAEAETGPAWTRPDDPRITRVGRILRWTGADELPQLWNVLRGDMSLVGPRPERPHFIEQFRDRVPHYLERHRIKSGITGWAQINGLRGDSSIEERTKYDIYYVENWSLTFDLKILLMTLFGRKTYGSAY